MNEITIKTCDGVVFNTICLCKSNLFLNLCDTLGTSSEILELTNINSKIFDKILQYFQNVPLDEYLDIDTHFLLELLVAVDYLDIPILIELICKKLGNIIKGKKPSDIISILQLKPLENYNTFKNINEMQCEWQKFDKYR